MKKIFTSLFILCSLLSFSQSTTLVISQVYGAGGNSGALYTADYVEIHNVSGVSQSLSGLSVQYASASATGAWTGVYALPAASIPAGGYYLVQMSTAGTVGSALPTPDAVAAPAIAMSGTSGRVAIVNGTTAVTACPSGLVDLVGYGASTCFEGAGATPALSSISAALRNNNGCADTDNSSADFTAGPPAPRNSASAVFSCTGPVATLTITGTISNFGNVIIGNSSPAQSYFISGANLTGAPGNVTVTAPADFEVSNNNSTWGASTTIPYTSATMVQTEVWVRFTPQSAGLKTGNVSNAGGAATTVNVPVSGTGILPPTATLVASGLSAFGNVCVNTTTGPNSFLLNGTNLAPGDITVGPLAGYTFATLPTGTYTSTLTLAQTGGTYTQTVYVQFTPTALQSYDGNIAITGGGAPAINIAASGAGANNPPVVTTGTATAVTTNSATVAGLINNTGCTSITAYGVAYSLTSGFTTGTVVNSSDLSAGSFSAALSGLTPATTYYYKVFATNSGGTSYGIERSFTTATPVLNATALTTFGQVCVAALSDAKSFTVSSTGLGTTNVNVGPLTGYSFSTTETGTYTASLSLTQPGGAYSQVIWVKLSPAVVQSYNGNIPVSGGGAPQINVAVTGSGVNMAPTAVTGDNTVVSPYNVTLNGSISNNGCSNITSYGIEYSSISGLANGYGKKVPASNLASGAFSSSVTNLVQGATYYYKAYAINNGGISYGEEKSFTTTSIPDGLTLYSVPVSRGTVMHYSFKTAKPAHYGVKLYNSNGQLVFRRDIILQVDFIDDWFTVPGSLAPGVYMFVVENTDGFKVKKPFMIR